MKILNIEVKIIELNSDSDCPVRDGNVLSSYDRTMTLSESRMKDMVTFKNELMHNLYLIKRVSMEMIKRYLNRGNNGTDTRFRKNK